MGERDRVLIVGGGLGGLAAAVACLRHGLSVRVYEKAPELAEIGAGLSLFEGARRVLKALDLDDRIVALGTTSPGGVQFHYQTAECLFAATPTGQELKIHRADLHRTLVEAVTSLDPTALQVDRNVVDCEQYAGGVVAHFEDGGWEAGRVLIGADGIRSRILERLWGAGKPNFTGWVAWRGLVPVAGLPRLSYDPVSVKWVGPRQEFLRYLVARGTLVNYVASREQPGWEVESWTERSSIPELLSHFDDWHPSVVALIEATPPETLFKWALFDREPLDRWTRGRITLLGDAAHPMLPYNGQGAGMALEDGLVLARALATYGLTPQALQRYEAVRRPRTTVAQRLARESAPSKPPDAFARLQEAQPDPDRMERRRLFRVYDPVTVPI